MANTLVKTLVREIVHEGSIDAADRKDCADHPDTKPVHPEMADVARAARGVPEMKEYP